MAMNKGSDVSEFTGKYEHSGRAGNWLINRFFDAARSLLEPVLDRNSRVLEIGCGAGYSTQRIARWRGVDDLSAAEPGPELLERAVANNAAVPMIQESVYSLAHADRAFDAVIMLEVLEHLEHPEDALRELHRVTGGYLLLSTPREPIWRMLNMARGKYLADLGNTPGHVQHWSTRALIRTTRPWFDLEGVATPLPWTILLLRPRR